MNIAVSGEKPNRTITICRTSRSADETQPWNGILFALSARDIGKYSNRLCDLYSNGSEIMGTDGIRLHLVQSNVIPEGAYRLLSKGKDLIALEEQDEKAPKYDFIVNPFSFGRTQITLPVCTEGRRISAALAVIDRNISDKYAVNVNYLQDALRLDCIWLAYLSKEDKVSIILKTKDDEAIQATVVIMPFPLED